MCQITAMLFKRTTVPHRGIDYTLSISLGFSFYFFQLNYHPASSSSIAFLSMKVGQMMSGFYCIGICKVAA